MDYVGALLTCLFMVVGVVLLFKGFRKYFVFMLDENSDHYGGELVADVLKAHDVSFVFTLCGGHISPILTAAEKKNIRVIDVRHEASAVFAADAVSRLSGTVGVAVVTAGPGVTNTVTAVKNAQMAESPVVILAGSSSGLLRGRGSLQDIDQLSLFRSICKWSKRINCVKDIIPDLCQAFYEARSGVPGPVLVEFPIDTLYPYKLIKNFIKIPENPKTFRQRIMSWYLRFYLFKLFANGFVSKSNLPGTEFTKIVIKSPWIPLPSNKQVEKFISLLLESQKPVLLAGSQIVLPPIPADETADNVKSLGIPVYLSGMARGLLGRNHPLVFRHARRAAMQEADLIILAGAVCDFRLDYGRVFNKKAKIIIINRNKKNLYLNSDLFWKPYLAINADVGSTVREISIILKSKFLTSFPTQSLAGWIDLLRSNEDKRDEEIRLSVLNKPEEHTNPLAVLWELEHHGLSTSATEESIIVADGGDFVGSAAYILRPRGPLSWLDPGPFGTLGVGGGFALGAKLCRPKATVWVIYGDGSAAFSIAEWDSLARHHSPAIGIIGNDACWSQIARDQVIFFKTKVGCSLNHTPYELIGSAYSRTIQAEDNYSKPMQTGGFLITKSNFDQLSHVFNQAKALSNQFDQPSIINCLISTSNFREGSISV